MRSELMMKCRYVLLASWAFSAWLWGGEIPLKLQTVGVYAPGVFYEIDSDRDGVSCTMDMVSIPGDPAGRSLAVLLDNLRIPAGTRQIRAEVRCTGTEQALLRAVLTDPSGNYSVSEPVEAPAGTGWTEVGFRFPEPQPSDRVLHSLSIQSAAGAPVPDGKFEVRAVRADFDPQKPVFADLQAGSYTFADDAPAIRVVRTEEKADVKAAPITVKLSLFDLYTMAPAGEWEWRVVPDAGIPLQLPFGCFRGDVEIRGGDGAPLDGFSRRFSLLPGARHPAQPDSVRRYEHDFGIIGGVAGNLTPENADAIGFRSLRGHEGTWSWLESAPGEFQTGRLAAELARWEKHGVRTNFFSTLYAMPEWYSTNDLPAFGRGFGNFLAAVAATARPLGIPEYELGNEDNGSTKFFYTNVARHGAAAIRAADPFALIGNSGTAFVDRGFLAFQADRHLFDALDAWVVHPYCGGGPTLDASPEARGIADQLRGVHEVAWPHGSMREIWSTEYGWPNTTAEAEKIRADFYTREMIILDNAGLSSGGLYTWERDWNICGLPALAMLQQFSQMRRGHRPVGLSVTPEGLWIAVYQRSGKYFAVAWADADAVPLPRHYDSALDGFGNPIDDVSVAGREPVYLLNPEPAVVEQARRAAVELPRGLLRKHRETVDPSLAAAADAEYSDAATLRRILLDWSRRSGPIPPEDQSAVDMIWQWFDAVNPGEPGGKDFDPKPLEARLVAAHDAGIDLPALRYLRKRGLKLNQCAAIADADGAPEAAARCRDSAGVLQAVAARFLRDATARQYAVFADLYTFDPAGKAQEKLSFVPGIPARTRLVVSSYSDREEPFTATFRLPSGWRCDPAEIRDGIPPRSDKSYDVVITAAAQAAEKVETVNLTLALPDKPDRAFRFDELEVLPGVTAAAELVTDLKPGVFRVGISNLETQPIAGTIRVQPADLAGKALALKRFQVPAGETAYVEIPTAALPPELAPEWRLNYTLTLDDGREFRVEESALEFTAALRAPEKMKIDAEFDEWGDALPLRLDKASYARGSYGANWTWQDCSAEVRMLHDDDNLYFAVIVTDQTFNQMFSDADLWQQDSVQMILANAEANEIMELETGLTPTGPRVFAFGGVYGGDWHAVDLSDARIAIRYLDGRIRYELALPWRGLPEALQAARRDGTLRMGILVNDDDAIVPRRYLERFEDTVVYRKVPARCAPLQLAPESRLTGAATGPRRAFYDDFERPAGDTHPGEYRYIVSSMPGDWVEVVDGKLRIANPDPGRDNVYSLMLGAVKLDPDRKWELVMKYRIPECAQTEEIAFAGLCTDLWGNVNYQYACVPSRTGGEWRTLVWPFGNYSTGKANLIFKNNGFRGLVEVDEATIREQK